MVRRGHDCPGVLGLNFFLSAVFFTASILFLTLNVCTCESLYLSSGQRKESQPRLRNIAMLKYAPGLLFFSKCISVIAIKQITVFEICAFKDASYSLKCPPPKCSNVDFEHIQNNLAFTNRRENVVHVFHSGTIKMRYHRPVDKFWLARSLDQWLWVQTGCAFSNAFDRAFVRTLWVWWFQPWFDSFIGERNVANCLKNLFGKNVVIEKLMPLSRTFRILSGLLWQLNNWTSESTGAPCECLRVTSLYFNKYIHILLGWK